MPEEAKYSTVEMDEKKANEGSNELERPFDEEFWLDVSVNILNLTFIHLYSVYIDE